MERLPYTWKDGLWPIQSKKTFDSHYDVIYKKYVRTGNRLMRQTRWEFKDLDVAVYLCGKSREEPALYNNLSAAWNHEFFFQCLYPGGVPPSQDMTDLIDLHFGGMHSLGEKLARMIRAFPAGGWIWLTEKNGHISLQTTFLNGSPLFEFGEGHKLLFGLDCWEHAYYADFGDDVEAYASSFLKTLNWQFVEMKLLAPAKTYEGEGADAWDMPEDLGDGLSDSVQVKLQKYRAKLKAAGELPAEEKEEEEDDVEVLLAR
jgi:Fe-Mn family superoxide dismutase